MGPSSGSARRPNIQQHVDAIKRSPSMVSRELRRNSTSAGRYDRSKLTVPPRYAAADGPPNCRLIRNYSHTSKPFWHNDGAHYRSAERCAASSRNGHLASISRDHLPRALPTQQPAVRQPTPSPLRTGRDHRRAHMRFTRRRRRRRFSEPMLSVHSVCSNQRTVQSPGTGKET